jgi:predicted GIY-YIG superfamily endonuclease
VTPKRISAKFFCVYILRSLKDHRRFYSGFTEDPEDRLRHHNEGGVPTTAPYRPWEFKTCIAFTDRERALEFERYLKTHAGRAFAARHL